MVTRVLRYDGTTGTFIDAVASRAGQPVLFTPARHGPRCRGQSYVTSLWRAPRSPPLRSGRASSVDGEPLRPFEETITVDYATSNGTATAGEDYTGLSGTLTFTPGVTTRTILIPTSQDTIAAPSESFYVTLSNPSTNATIADNQGEATILGRFQPTALFADSFENGQWNGMWVEDSQNDWFTSTQRATDGSYSAEVDGRATDATLTMANPTDMTLYGSAELTFDWLIEKGLDTGEYLALDFCRTAQAGTESSDSEAMSMWKTSGTTRRSTLTATT